MNDVQTGIKLYERAEALLDGKSRVEDDKYFIELEIDRKDRSTYKMGPIAGDEDCEAVELYLGYSTGRSWTYTVAIEVILSHFEAKQYSEYLVMFKSGWKGSSSVRNMIIGDNGKRTGNNSFQQELIQVIEGTGLENIRLSKVYKLKEINIT